MEDLLAIKRPKKSLFIRVIRIREIGALFPLIILLILTSLINKSFYSPDNILNMLRATSYIFIAGVGMTYVLCARGLDLSVGSQMGLSGIIIGILLAYLGLPVWFAILITLLAGATAGAVNGVLITLLGIPPFIATLATYYSYRGIVMGVTKGAPISPMPDAFKVIGLGKWFGISIVIYFIAVLFMVATFVLRKTRYGLYILATGGNKESTRLAGINTKAIIFSTYVLTGVLAFTAGIFFTSRFSSAQPNTGTGDELRIIAACIIGGVSLFGGSGSIVGTFVGSAFIVVLDNAMTMARISGYWKQAILGGIIIIAVIIDMFRKGELLQRE